jgi:PhnB protein
MPDHTPVDQLDLEIEVLLAGGDATGLTELARFAAQLLDLPDENFKQRLKSDLERRANMPATMTSAIAHVREGFRTVTPYITVAEADKLIDFLKQTFGAVEVTRHPHGGPDGFHAEVRLGDSMLMIGPAERGHEAPAILHVYVDDCDAVCARSVAAGAASVGDPADRPYGERSGFVTDPFGNTFYVATRFASAPAPEGYSDILPYLHPRKARPYIEFLRQAFGAEELGVYEQDGRVMHAAVRIGDSVVEMGEPVDAIVPTGGFFMYVKDVDAVYERAIAAGAASLRPPTDEPAGHRGAALRDPAGYTWYAASLL